MTFTRYRILMEEYEDSPSADDILLAVHLPKHRQYRSRYKNLKVIQGGDSGGAALLGMLNIRGPGETRYI